MADINMEKVDSVIIEKKDSVSELDDSPSSENIETFPTDYRFFALYTYHANRPSNAVSPTTPDEDGRGSSVADFLQKEAIVNSDLSISVIATDLPAENETALRSAIAKRLSKGTVYGGSGNVASLEIGLSCGGSSYCYYCLLRQVGEDQLTIEGDDSITSREYVVCFVASQETVLDLFRPELDVFSHGLLPLVDTELTEIGKIQEYLLCWYTSSVEFLCRSVQKLHNNVAYQIHAAMKDYKVEIEGGDISFKEDIEKFSTCCSFAGLLHHSNMSDVECSPDTPIDTTPGDISNKSNKSSGKISMLVTQDKITFETTECNAFCTEWAQALYNGDDNNPVYLRQVIENFKLKAIQDMNTLQRLIRHAENDHYALYRSFLFLKNCGNGDILLETAKMEDHTLTSHDAPNVLKALQEFIEERGGF